MLRPWIILVCLLLIGSACSDDGGAKAPALASDGMLSLAVLVPVNAGPGLQMAAEDLRVAALNVTGVTSGNRAAAAARVTVLVDDARADVLGSQGYELSVAEGGLVVAAATETGAMYGLYDVIGDLGVVYHHPEETWFPSDPSAKLPWPETPRVERPRFDKRGFHEHTQHPIVMSDYYLRPAPEHRSYVSRYLKWMARNRQNAASWHMLKSVDLDPWLPYIADVIAEGHGYGIDVGMVMSFVDEQQNNFKVVDAGLADDDETQIRAVLGRFLAVGFDFFTFQIGSSEFTKPDDDAVLGWLDVVASYADVADVYAWIHTTCDLDADDGTRFFHLPGRADARLGAWAHTTMFYDLEHPAPVYGCESFNGQRDFMTAEDGERPLVYFPETAWWLGFDNNLPLALPLTGRTRENDILRQLDGLDVKGHITFTTGREWGYWRYDHYLTQVTWAGDLTWNAYLRRLAPVFGDDGEALVEALIAWTDLQAQHFLVDNPLVYFYLAGELVQDEIGQQAGILARRPKLAFAEVVAYDDAEFETWHTRDFRMLESMLGQYDALLSPLAAPVATPATTSERLYAEAHATLALYVLRLRQTLALYGGVIAARRWRLERALDAPDEAVRTEALAAAEAKLVEARGFTTQAQALISAGEARYRYDVDILARPKPASLTSYPFGYLEETSRAHFWVRRDDQLEGLIGVVFDTAVDAWEETPDLVANTDGSRMVLLEPDSALAGTVLTGFIPRILVGMRGLDGTTGPEHVSIAEDFNENGLPDPLTETALTGTRTDAMWAGSTPVMPIVAYNSAGESFGTLNIVDARLSVALVIEGEALVGLTTGELAGDVVSAQLVGLVTSFAGIDAESVQNLLKDVFGVPDDAPLPAKLPVRFSLSFAPALE